MNNRAEKPTTKKEFMYQLHNALHGAGVDFDGDMYSDFEQHFTMGLAQGLSEAEVCEKLGEIQEIVNSYLPEGEVQKSAVSLDETVDTGYQTDFNSSFQNDFDQSQNVLSKENTNENKTNTENSGNTPAFVALIVCDVLFLAWMMISLGGVVVAILSATVGVGVGAIGALVTAMFNPLGGLFLGLSTAVLMSGVTILMIIASIHLVKGYIFLWKLYINLHIKLATGKPFEIKNPYKKEEA